LLKVEISEKQARSIKHQLTIARLPLAKDVDDFAFKDTPINEALVRDRASGAFLTQQRASLSVVETCVAFDRLVLRKSASRLRSAANRPCRSPSLRPRRPEDKSSSSTPRASTSFHRPKNARRLSSPPKLRRGLAFRSLRPARARASSKSVTKP